MPFNALSRRAFTLLELMVVIAIITILVGFSAPQFTRQIAKAKLVEVHTLAGKNQAVIEEFLLLNGKFPSADEFSARAVTGGQDSVVASIEVENVSADTGDLKLTLNATTGIAADQYFAFSRASNALWSCRSSLPVELLPDHCSTIVAEEAAQ